MTPDTIPRLCFRICSTTSPRSPTAAPSCSRRPSACTAWSRRSTVSGRQTRTGEDSAHARGPDRPAGLRHRVRSWHKPTTCHDSGSGGTRCPARPWRLRERRRVYAACDIDIVRHRAWRRRGGRAGSRSITWTDPDARGPAAHVLQRARCYLDAGVSELRPRGGAVSVQLRPGIGTGTVLSRLLPLLRAAYGDLRFPGCGAPARLRGGDRSRRGVAAAAEQARGETPRS